MPVEKFSEEDLLEFDSGTQNHHRTLLLLINRVQQLIDVVNDLEQIVKKNE